MIYYGEETRSIIKIEKFVAKNVVIGTDRKTMKFSSFPKSESSLVLLPESQGLPNLLSQRKLESFPEDSQNLIASKSWLNRWKAFYGIWQLNVGGKKLSANKISTTLFCIKLTCWICDGSYSLNKIFNSNEKGLNYKMLSDETLALKTEKEARRVKMSKECITIITCTNASGLFSLIFNEN